MTKRKSLLTVLSGLSMACLAGAFTFLPVNQAKAEETQKTVVENVLMEGAYVRTTGEGNETYNTLSGIRFVMFIDQETYNTAVETYGEENVEVGMYYVGRNIDVGGTIDVTTDEEMQDINTIPKGARHAVMEAYTDSSAKTESASMAFSVAQLGIPESGYNAQLIANGYLKTTDSEGNETYTWATNPTTRSVAEMASIALFEGATHADLHTFVNAVATEETFKFANDVVETDMYKATDLGLTAPANLKIVWDSSNEEVATFDENGALVKVGEGTTTITASIGNNVREMTLNIVAPNPLIVTEDNYLTIYNPDIASDPKLGLSTMTCVTAGEGEVADFTGGYTGKAMRLPAISNPGYILYSAYTAEELAEISKVYNTVSLWFAVDNIASGTFFIMNTATSFAVKYHGGNKGYTNATCGNWEKWTISISDYISLLQQDQNGRNYVQLFNAWPNSGEDAPVKEEGTDRICFYVGNVEFGFNSTIYTVTSISASNNEIIATDGYSKFRTYIAAGGAEIANFTGDYDGAAIQLPLKEDYVNHNAAQRMVYKYTAEQLNGYFAKQGYTHVSLWFAVDGIENGSIGFSQASGHPNFLYMAGYGDKTLTSADNGKWQQVTISISNYISTFMANSTYSNLYRPTLNSLADGEDADTTYSIKFYIGNMELVKSASIVKVNSATYSQIYLQGNAGAGSYVAAGSDAIKDFAGDYTGGATKLTRYTNDHYRFKNFYTLEQLNTLKKTYSNISLYIAIDQLTEGQVRFTDNSSTKNYYTFMGKAGYGNSNAANFHATPTGKHLASATWHKITISIDAYISLVTTTDETTGETTVLDYCPLFGTWVYGTVTGG
ncbi:MAG: hypothetical protein IKA40_01750, partial [Clostridia bacterium]|nr:hypothetical protein [Clostridia bacterium]